MPKTETDIAKNFVNDARSVTHHSQANPQVDRAIAEMKVIGVDEDDAVEILRSAVADAKPEQSNLIHVFTGLEKRRKTP